MATMRMTFPGNQKVDAHYKGMVIHTDQPVDEGGDGTAPSPFDLFVASLGACAGYFTLSFCEARKLPLDGIEVVQETERDPKTHMISKVRIEVRVPKSFPDRYKELLVKAVDACTVKKHILNPPAFEVVTKTI